MTDCAWHMMQNLRQAQDEAASLRDVCRPPTTPPARPRHPVRHHRTIFISDVHLGTRGCKSELLLDFLAHNTCDTLYIVGDLIDGWQLKRRWFWNASHSALVAALLDKADRGTRIVYIPGNHDEFARAYIGRTIAGIEIAGETVHVTAAGKRLLVLHGDRFDSVVAYAKWLARVGDAAYSLALALNDRLYGLRQRLGLPYWSLSAYLKNKVKKAVEYVSGFETVVAHAAATLSVDGVVCGHIHQAEKRQIGKILYLNDGDWVESCTALVEDALGNMEILQWAPYFMADDLARAGKQPTQEAALIPV
jgi:UDP-2,3-diacylglucosamine pyrophosphatase LpxH